ncbi:MAG: hypothetical protein K2L45_05565 [Muribaculaceae bacterium]|nr:hypothetical protein [Muribaculaceae bacterium]
MKKTIILVLLLMSVITTFADVSLSSTRGVWANDNAEAVITDEICILYAKVDSTMQAILEVPSLSLTHKTVFEKDGSVTAAKVSTPLEIKTEGEFIVIGGERMRKVEEIEIVAPYEMPECKDKSDVGKCLQEWRLGVKFVMQDGEPFCEINTNRHLFIYSVVPSMVYIRAAATRNNDEGTLFFQNIRMMKNQNTGEYTMSIMPENFNLAKKDLEIDNSKFNANACYFSEDGGIYWSLISYSPDLILLNGCGETYQVARPAKDDPIEEWIKYMPY